MTTKRLLLAALLPALLAACGVSREVSAIDAGAATCTSCHGDPARPGDAIHRSAPPIGSDGGNGGAHLAHLDRRVACGSCHVVPTSATHANLTVEVRFSGVALADGATPSRSGGTCSGVYCHGATLGAGGRVPAPSWSGGPLACDACHGAPPPSHAASSTACAGCHPGTVRQDGSIDLAGGLHVNGRVDAAGGGHAPGWADPGQHGPAGKQDLASCRGCHGQDLAGGTAVSCGSCHAAAGYAAWQSNCTFCHGTKLQTYTAASLPSAAPPRGTAGETATTARAVGAHQRHLSGGALGPAVACATCHVVPASLAHLDGSPQLAFGAAATRGGVSPVWNGATCASTYCHGATVAGGTNKAPSWTGGASQAACGTCHGVPPPAPHTTSTACGSCHDGYTATVANAALHLNGTVDATGASHPAGWAAKDQHGYAVNRDGLASCRGCHGQDLAGGTAVSCATCHTAAGYANWQSNCTFCHGTKLQTYTAASLPSAAPPRGTAGETEPTARAVGAHQRHLSGGALGPAVACVTCHVVPAGLAHLDGSPQVAFGAAATIGGANPVWNGATCASTYCHGATVAGGTNKAPSWTGGVSQAACGTCHGVPPPAPHSTSTACGSCHDGYTATVANAALHLNGTLDATGASHPAGWAAKDQHGYSVNRDGLASCKACHGAALEGGSGPSCASCHASAGFASWQTSCTFCHGNRTTLLASPPVDTQGRSATTNVSVGLHASHLGTTLMTTPACTACHPDRTASNVITDAAHVDGNGIAEVAFGPLARTGGAAAAYTRTSATAASCASVYCHGRFTGGTGATVGWTSTVQVSCTSCHGAPPATGEHSRHGGRSCGDCHPGYTTTAVNRGAHVDGAKQVGNRITSFSPATGSCTSSCHGNEIW